MKGRVFIEIIEFEGVEGCLEKLNELSELLFSEDSGGLEAGIYLYSEIFQLTGTTTYKLVPKLLSLLFSSFANPDV